MLMLRRSPDVTSLLYFLKNLHQEIRQSVSGPHRKFDPAQTRIVTLTCTVVTVPTGVASCFFLGTRVQHESQSASQ